MILTGSCLCGRYRYRVDIPSLDDVAHCHCSMCRRASGAVAVTWATVSRQQFQWLTSAAPAYRSSASALRHFCDGCGAALVFASDDRPDEYEFTVATLDAPGRAPPDRHVWYADRVTWLNLDEQLPKEMGETVHPPSNESQ